MITVDVRGRHARRHFSSIISPVGALLALLVVTSALIGSTNADAVASACVRDQESNIVVEVPPGKNIYLREGTGGDIILDGPSARAIIGDSVAKTSLLSNIASIFERLTAVEALLRSDQTSRLYYEEKKFALPPTGNASYIDMPVACRTGFRPTGGSCLVKATADMAKWNTADILRAISFSKLVYSGYDGNPADRQAWTCGFSNAGATPLDAFVSALCLAVNRP